MKFNRAIFVILLSSSLFLSGWIPPIRPAPLAADWCQCVIFVLNLLGIRQIPGEYWTAATLAQPDRSGKTWMDYQGYEKRLDSDLPESGDLLVLANGAEVITEQTWDGSEHLVPVQVDVWAGHLGIVLRAEEVEKEGTEYWRIHLLSANWGVNSHALGVVGSCFNADESAFLLPVGYKKASFFFASDPEKMRERMINRAQRWASLGLPANPNTTLDGFPVSPSGFISQVLEPVGSQPLIPLLKDTTGSLIPIPPENALAGDLMLFGENPESGIGIITSIINVEKEKSWNGQIISFFPGGRTRGPEDWHLTYSDGKWSKNDGDPLPGSIRFSRYAKIPAYPVVTRFELQNGSEPQSLNYSIEWINGGGQELSTSELSLVVYERQETSVNTSRPIETIKLDRQPNLSPGIRQTCAGSIASKTKGDYQVWLQYQTKENTIIPVAKLDVTIDQ